MSKPLDNAAMISAGVAIAAAQCASPKEAELLCIVLNVIADYMAAILTQRALCADEGH